MTFPDMYALPTPAAVIDLERLQNNTRWMARRAHSLGVKLRPHVKTHKCVEAARHQVEDHFGGITVSTLAEAEFFSQAGFDDITYAVPLAPGRIARSLTLAQSIRALNVLVDHPLVVHKLAEACDEAQVSINVLIKIDCGYHRAGLLPDSPELYPLAQAIVQAPYLHFLGVLAHGGHAYDCLGAEAIRSVAESERFETVRAAESLRAQGIDVEVVSVGSTPTACHVENLEGVTELRPGNYALFDLFQAQIGSCQTHDIALSVVTEVIGVYPERLTVLIDAGALALSKDRGATHTHHTAGFGLVCDAHGELIPGLHLSGLSQEHGKIEVDASQIDQYPQIGDRLRILPNHSCLVTALHDTIYIAQGETINEYWRPMRGW